MSDYTYVCRWCTARVYGYHMCQGKAQWEQEDKKKRDTLREVEWPRLANAFIERAIKFPNLYEREYLEEWRDRMKTKTHEYRVQELEREERIVAELERLSNA